MDSCFFNGKILPLNDVKININELGLLRAYAVFDYLRTYHGKPFRIDDYLKRFRNSASELRLPLKFSDDKIKKIVSELLQNQKQDVGIRFLLTGGYTEDSMAISKPNFFILIEKLFDYPEEVFKKGVKLITCEFQRFMPQVKTTNYLNAILLQPEKEKEKAFEILYHQEGMISETARNNFFIVKNEVLFTPKENILSGITRKVILELAKKNKIKTKEKKIFLSEIQMADESFITGSSKGIVPVVQVDNLKIRNGKVGEMTKKFNSLFVFYAKSL